MPLTIEDLFALNAHRSIEALELFDEFTIDRAMSALVSRFGFSRAELRPVIGPFVSRVQDAIRAAQIINSGQQPLEAERVVNPFLPADFAYTVLASLPDPRNPGHPVEIPWTTYANQPLTLEEIQDQATAELTAFSGTRDSLPGGGSPDLRMRDRRFRELVRDEYEYEIAPSISVVSTYSRVP